MFVLLFSLFPFTYSMASDENYGFYTGLNFGKSNDTGKGKNRSLAQSWEHSWVTGFIIGLWKSDITAIQ